MNKPVQRLVSSLSITLLLGVAILGCSSEPRGLTSSQPQSSAEVSTSNPESSPEEDNPESSPKEECDPSNLAQASNFEFEHNVHESLPSDWQAEYFSAIDNLENLFPISDCVFAIPSMQSPMQVYAWSSAVGNPWPDERPGMGGACICGDGSGRWMVLEINADEFRYDSLHRYAVIAHEYYHVFQIARSGDLMKPVWLVEGGAKTFEELFTRTYYGQSEFDNGLFPVTANGLENPAVFEDYVNVEGDQNYNFSSFMVLALIQELMSQGNVSEEQALKLVLSDYWSNLRGRSDWRMVFSETFGLAPDDFYGLIQKYQSEASPETYYSGDVVAGEQVRGLMPSKHITLEDVAPN